MTFNAFATSISICFHSYKLLLPDFWHFDIDLLLQSFLGGLVISLSHTQLPTLMSLFPFPCLIFTNSSFIRSFFPSTWMLSFLCYLQYQVLCVSIHHVGAFVPQESVLAVSLADLSGPSALCFGLLHLILVRGDTQSGQTSLPVACQNEELRTE